MRHFAAGTYLRFGGALLFPILLVLIWDLAREQPSAFFEQSLNNYGGLSTDVTSFGERWFGFVNLLAYGIKNVEIFSIQFFLKLKYQEFFFLYHQEIFY